MSEATISGVCVAGLTCCVGGRKSTGENLGHLYKDDPMVLERLMKMTGIRSRYLVEEGTTTLDLGEAAARRLLVGQNVNVDELDAIVFVTQTPDFWQPCNANLLHGRLGCSKRTAAFDINQGCSGWVYGLQVAFSLVAAGQWNRVLLLAGDVTSAAIHEKDRSVVPLFGDACSATLVEKSENAGKSYFAMHSDGKGSDAICIPAGGWRRPERDNLEEKKDADGNIRTDANLHMNGLEVFNFTLREEPKAIEELLTYAGSTKESVDGFALHQANQFILTTIARKVGIPSEKMPFDAGAVYGNLSSASIPSAVCVSFGDRLKTDPLRIVASGFGVGLSWGSVLLQLGPLKSADLFLYGED